MGFLENLIKQLNQNKIFRYLSSVKLAVPLMLVLSALVAYGTVLESRYNSEYSGLIMYKSDWFSAVMVLLWVNIFCATISRIPFKKHHTGFVITHIGLLTLLIGGFLTNTYGIDGQLSVTEGQASSTVVLPNLMAGYQLDNSPTPVLVKFKKMIFSKKEGQLDFINDEVGAFFKVEEYLPFAKVEKVYKVSENPNNINNEVALSFMLKSNFFNVNDWLHTKNNPVMQLGPATLKIIKVDNIDSNAPATKPSKKRKVSSISEMAVERKPASASGEQLAILDFKSGQVLKTLSLKDLAKKPIVFNSLKISLVKKYKSAVVSANKLVENSDPNSQNPALELKVEKDAKSVREILYGKFEQFSLNKEGVFGYRFVFKSDAVAPVATTESMGSHQSNGASASSSKTSNPHEAAAGSKSNTSGVSESAAEPVQPMQAPSSAQMGSRVVEFRVNPKDPKRVKISLYKNDVFVQSEILTEGQSFQTPWMGMKIFLGTVQVGAEESSEVVAINPEKRSQLPPSALKIRTPEGSFWLTEGDQKHITSGGRSFVAYFGREFIELPFDINLRKFTKYDYPGTSTAMSYESLVQIGKSGVDKLISMNEPLKQSDFTVYQSSYIMDPGQTPVSIFSVNKDPGRFLKYLGSLILAIGVITYTLMKSNYYKNFRKGSAK